MKHVQEAHLEFSKWKTFTPIGTWCLSTDLLNTMQQHFRA